MDIYHIWCNLKRGVSDVQFADDVTSYLEHLKGRDQIRGYRLTRRKLGLGPSHLPEFHITIEFENMAQMDAAFTNVSSRADPVEGLHHAVNSKVEDIFFALYRDFPDEGRERGEEKF